MNKISKSNISSKVFIFLLTSFLQPFIVLYLILGSHSIPDIMVCGLISFLNIYISYRIVFGEYEIWIDSLNEVVVLKKTKVELRFSYVDFLKFNLKPYGPLMSTVFKFYKLELHGAGYKIRFYVDKIDSFSSIIDQNKEANMVETALKQAIKSRAMLQS